MAANLCLPSRTTAPLPDDAALEALALHVTRDLSAAPCAVIAAARRDDETTRAGVGVSGVLAPAGARADAGTVFDLASVTKPFTALTAARLARRGVLSLATPLGALVAEARGTASEHVPLELFLAHRAGLAPHRALWGPLLRGARIDRSAALREAAAGRRAECAGPPPREGFLPAYSDLGYLLAGEAIARAAGSTLAAAIAAEVCAPLALGACSAAALRAVTPSVRVAPTEHASFRGGVVVAAVHDENAWALAGLGVAGHAGLFGTAADVLGLGVALLDVLAGERDDWLRAAELEPLLRERPGGSLRAGFDGKSGTASSAGRRFGPRTFGHLGFTGVSLWVDPDARLVGVLLTNRVHPSRARDAIRGARPYVYDGIGAWGAR